MLYVVNISTWLTFLRIVLAPWVAWSIHQHAWMSAFIIFCIAAITDFFDGYYARLYKQETYFGRLLDPVADKVLLFSTLVALYQISDQKLIPLWFVLLVIGKDLILMGGALFLLVRKNYVTMVPSILSKWITALLMLFFMYCMLLHYTMVGSVYIDQLIIFFACSIFLILSDYVHEFFKKL